MTKRTINVPILARVEGEGALVLDIKNNALEKVLLQIYEPPRLFESFLEGRHYDEIIDIVARICGICPVAYQMSASRAIEDCFNITPTPWVREMRRLFYCGEWIESHSLHIHLLALPDFLGFKTALEMAAQHKAILTRGLALQSFGNALIKLLGGRSVHPVGATVGGFYRAPSIEDVNALLKTAQSLIGPVRELIAWLSQLELPKQEQVFTTVSLYHPHEYPMNEGKIVSSSGLKIDIEAFDAHFKEEQVAHSTALHCLLEGQPYLVGPLARVNHAFGHLPSEIHLLLQSLGLSFPSRNMFMSIIARAVEVYYAILESIRILSAYRIPDTPHASFSPRPGLGVGATEAPRGLLWQQFLLGEEGEVKKARIIPPTSQNQARIEADLKESLTRFGLNEPHEALRQYSEMIIRNYDPCISCATHFLDLTVNHVD